MGGFYELKEPVRTGESAKVFVPFSLLIDANSLEATLTGNLCTAEVGWEEKVVTPEGEERIVPMSSPPKVLATRQYVSQSEKVKAAVAALAEAVKAEMTERYKDVLAG